MATISNPKKALESEARVPPEQSRDRMLKTLAPRFVILATQFDQGTADDRRSVVGELLGHAEPLAIVARMSAFLAAYCSVESAAAFCRIIEECHPVVDNPDRVE